MIAKPNILVVDDTPANLRLLTGILKGRDYMVRPVPDGVLALSAARAEPPDLVLLDIMMPNMSGYEVCERLKADEHTRDIPVIFLSAKTELADKVKAFSVGGVDYITKPFQTGEVIARVQIQLKLQAQNRQLQQQAIELEQAGRLAEQARNLAEQANRAKSVFLANMSHELRTPLNAILGFAQILGHSPNLNAEEQGYLGIMNRSSEHLLALINDVLDFSKIEAGYITMNNKAFNLHCLLDDVVELFRIRAMKKSLRLLFDRADDVPQTVKTDEVKLRQVLINLMSNAVKFVEKGSVELRVRNEKIIHDSSFVILNFSVIDTGPGITLEEMDQLFEPFAQTETGRQAQEGTGLGLPISRKFVRLMGGDITVKSEAGHGAAFFFDIQCELAASIINGESPIVKRVIALESGQPRYRILIVDDKPDNRKLLVNFLNPVGFELREAANGKEAVETWEQWEPHLIWMDLRMPVMDGYEATKIIRERQKTPAAKIILVSASSFDDERVTALSRGCDDFLLKPFREANLFELMAKHLGIRFVYEKSIRKKIKIEEVLTPKALAILPDELRTGLRTACDDGDIYTTLKLIEQIRKPGNEQLEQLADALAELVNSIQFDTILEFLGMERHRQP
ncbi:MAG: response regulator [Gammaproteobacteria bacterium]|nr:response regulator [Gammaproteobacteria bacterium]